MVLHIHTDGSCKRNPGVMASCGFVIKDSRYTTLTAQCIVLPRDKTYSNNYAEWIAPFHAFKWLVDNKLNNNQIFLYSDSKMMVNQALRKYKINYNLNYGSAARQTLDIIYKYKLRVSWKWISRDYNVEADCLAEKYITGEYHVRKSNNIIVRKKSDIITNTNGNC